MLEVNDNMFGSFLFLDKYILSCVKIKGNIYKLISIFLGQVEAKI
jgi:hypothetical protein